MRAMAVGDPVLIYHTGDEKAVIGLAKVVRTAYPDPKLNNEKMVVVDLEAASGLPKASHPRGDQGRSRLRRPGAGAARVGCLSFRFPPSSGRGYLAWR
jgi:hypothetical protein